MKNIIVCLVIFCTCNSLSFGRLLAVSDDWMISSSSPDSEQFAISSMDWLTEGNSNKTILFDKGYHDYFSNDDMIIALQDHGYNVAITDPLTWDAATLDTYGAVVWSSAFEGLGQKLLDYTNTGGNVMIVGGQGGPSSVILERNTLLNPYGIADGDIIMNGSVQITSFSSHPSVQGVTHLYSLNPSNFYLLSSFDGTVVSSQNDINYAIAVPEPTTLILLGLGGLLIRKR